MASAICRDFDGYRDSADAYFSDMDAFRDVVAAMRAPGDAANTVALSCSAAAKTAPAVLCQVVDHGLNPLVFTLDNGYISDEAKANIRRVTEQLGVDHVFAERNTWTPSLPTVSPVSATSAADASKLFTPCPSS